MKKRSKVAVKPSFDPTNAEGQIPFTGNLHYDLRVFTLMNMEISEGKLCLEILQRNNLLEPFEKTYQMLKEISNTPAPGHPVKVAELAPGLLTGVLIKIRSINSKTEQKLAQQMTIQLSKAMLIAFVNGNQKYAQDILNRIAEAVTLSCRQYAINPDEFNNKFQNELSSLPKWVFRGHVTNSIHNGKQKKEHYIWNEKGNLSELVYQLKNEKLIKRQKPFFELFDTNCENITVEWDMPRKFHLARLIFILFTKNYCYIRGTKGYFAHAERHFTSFTGEPLQRGTLKRLSSRINNEPNKFIDVINKIDDIIEKV